MLTPEQRTVLEKLVELYKTHIASDAIATLLYLEDYVEFARALKTLLTAHRSAYMERFETLCNKMDLMDKIAAGFAFDAAANQAIYEFIRDPSEALADQLK